ncbi:MAG: bifunctional nuclease family protein, partial [Acidobacteriota bacterium]|nr:bifunctional nuclease family protein [Acidobacteriota bacterium]
PIYVGAPEAAAIAYALQGVSAPRPMTHDLLGNVITSLDARLFSVEITDLVDNTFFATLRLLRDQREILISARPSDAVALALRVGAPILVVDELMAREGKILELSYEDDDESEGLEPFDATSEAELVAQFEEFLDQVKPEDFDA